MILLMEGNISLAIYHYCASSHCFICICYLRSIYKHELKILLYYFVHCIALSFSMLNYLLFPLSTSTVNIDSIYFLYLSNTFGYRISGTFLYWLQASFSEFSLIAKACQMGTLNPLSFKLIRYCGGRHVHDMLLQD